MDNKGAVVAYLEPVDPVEAGRAAAELVCSYPTLAVDPALVVYPIASAAYPRAIQARKLLLPSETVRLG